VAVLETLYCSWDVGAASKIKRSGVMDGVIRSIATEVNTIGQAGLGIAVDGTDEWIVQSSGMTGGGV
jgi:hypothetical protein